MFNPYDIDYKVISTQTIPTAANTWEKIEAPGMTRRVLLTSTRTLAVAFNSESATHFSLSANNTWLLPVGRHTELNLRTAQAGNVNVTFLGGRQSWGANHTTAVEGRAMGANSNVTVLVPDNVTHMMFYNSGEIIVRTTYSGNILAAHATGGIKYSGIATSDHELNVFPVSPGSHLNIHTPAAQNVRWSFITDYGRDYQVLKPIGAVATPFNDTSNSRLIQDIPKRTDFVKLQALGNACRALIVPGDSTTTSSSTDIQRGMFLPEGEAFTLPLRENLQVWVRGHNGAGNINAEFYRIGSVTSG